MTCKNKSVGHIPVIWRYKVTAWVTAVISTVLFILKAIPIFIDLKIFGMHLVCFLIQIKGPLFPSFFLLGLLNLST